MPGDPETKQTPEPAATSGSRPYHIGWAECDQDKIKAEAKAAWDTSQPPREACPYPYGTAACDMWWGFYELAEKGRLITPDPLPENTARFLASLGYTTKPDDEGSFVIVDDLTADEKLKQRRGILLGGATINAGTKFPNCGVDAGSSSPAPAAGAKLAPSPGRPA